MKWHPLAEKFPLLEGKQWEDFKEDIRLAKGNHRHIEYRMKKGVREGLDGRLRFKACSELGIKPKMRLVNVKDADVPRFILRANLFRRHQSQEARDVLIGILRAEGQSTRQIAEQIGVSSSTVSRQLSQNGTAEITTPEGKVVGKDGRLHPPKKPKKLCARCTRVGHETKGCPMCAELRKTGKKKAPKPEEPGTEPKDAFGVVIPKACRDAYCDPWIQDAIDYIGLTVTTWWDELLSKGMEKRAKHYPWFKPKDFIDGVGMVGNTMDKLLDHLKEMRPAGVCPACNGEKCKDCKMSGLVPREIHKKLKEILNKK